MLRIAAIIIVLITAIPCQAFNWEYLGMDGVSTTTIEADSDALRVYVGTDEGFHFLDLQSGLWTECVDQGQTDRKVTLIRRRLGLADEILLGRLNSSGNSYLELSDSLGSDFTVVHQSDGGAFLDLEGYGQEFFACSIANANPGELLKTTDGGTTWLPIFGHGHTSMTSLERGTFGGLYLAGDNGISYSMDDGNTWEPVSDNLPEGEMITSFELFHLGNDNFDYGVVASTQDTVYYSLQETSGQFFFIPVLAASFRSTTTFYISDGWYLSAGLAAVTYDGRLMFSRNDGSSWEDQTGNLPGQPIAVAYCSDAGGSLFVCTLNNGVFRRKHVSPVEQDHPNQPLISLDAWPNPFNPRVNLSFEMAEAGGVELVVFDTKGRKVSTIHEGWMHAGFHQLTWDAHGTASGVYLAQISTPEGKRTARLVLVR